MLGDEAQQTGTAGSRDGVPAGPRHAAPRKSLLTKLHVPAGKAVALAAMPTAVLMGMGFTPHLAQADDMPKSSPFKPGPCVTRSDTAKDPVAGTDKAKATPTPTTSPSATGSAGQDKGAGATPTPGPSATTPSSVTDPITKILPRTQSAPKSTPSASPSPTPTPTPSPTKSTNPLDPLGVGDLLGGLLGGLTGGGSTPAPAPTTQTPTPAPTTTAPKPTPTASQTPGSGGTSGATSGGSGKSSTGSPAKDPGKTAADTAKGAVKGLTDTADKAVPAPTATGASTPTDGSQSYPCPTYDAKALAAADTETGIPLLPDDSWTLKSSKLSLHGLDYAGIVQVRTWSGQVKDVLKFTATGVDIADLWQIVDQPQGGHTWVKARAGSTSTIRNGTVTMYTESLSGNLLGLIPITFTPKAPPPLTLPELFFTDVTVVQAAQFGGDLHVPGMQVLPGQS
ncbi:hypothetical protein V2S66_01930 [Streptomyces sp. V4-01]|uniref:Uncharacterized protein n=1 Tax=Actinacidiphila polyblastidii TaxID=3110430 RepID=A0ABU7P4J1_9ACTN|nr:hypothetical protein [Streptomyces sp. V4-01]